MKPRTASLALFAALAAASGCFDTRIIPAEPSEGAASSAGAGTGTGGAGVGSSAEGGALGDAGDAGDAGGTEGALGGAGALGGGGGQPQATGVTWLALVESEAPSSQRANAELGINGSVYAYADDCATLHWDPSTRCASGRLCSSGASFENWGIAVGFDFRVTGPDGSPPDSKLVWDPEERGVRGVTWQIHGDAPGLQLWVLNMAPAFDGQCGQQSCEIAGPPDGASAASQQGSLLFDQMVKDYWGGRGLSYVYDPAAVYALQFKLPAVNVGSASFDFCVDALGVVH